MSLTGFVKDIIAKISAESEPSALEALVRMAFIHYFLRISTASALEFANAGDDKINLKTPVLFQGQGKIRLHPNVVFGAFYAPGNLSYTYIVARSKDSRIEFHENVAINNRACIVAETASITIGKNTIIGPECMIGDSNAHELAVTRRMEPDSHPLPVSIGENVFIGSRVTILKGVTIGDGCVIAAGSVVPPRFEAPANKIIAGNPARIVADVPAE